MEVEIGSIKLVLVKGDITEEETDAIVNAANTQLAGGGGVDGAIHRAGGPEINEECEKIGSCPTGSAVMTNAGDLKAWKVIHAVGPVYKDGKSSEAELLASAYRKSLELASEEGLKSVSFPSISTGNYGYPVEQAAFVALRAIVNFMKQDKQLEVIRFVLFSDRDLDVYEKALAELASEAG
ncbi:MAG: O-acetyl-ADP-ribose deacetylase [Thermodesulfobacteriota bacterium]